MIKVDQFWCVGSHCCIKIIPHRGAGLYFWPIRAWPSAWHGETARHLHLTPHHNSSVAQNQMSLQLSLILQKITTWVEPWPTEAINFDCNRFSNVCNTWNKKYKYGANSLSNCRGTRKPCEVRRVHGGCCRVVCELWCTIQHSQAGGDDVMREFARLQVSLLKY